MRVRFAQFVASRGYVAPARAHQLAKARPQFREVLGAIALGHGLITLEQLEDVLQHLAGDALFGEVAIRLGYLSPEHVDRLLAIQELQEAIEIGEALLLDGLIGRQQLLEELTSFFASVGCPAAT